MTGKELRQESMWFIHNMVAHPLSQVFHMLGMVLPDFAKLSDWIHDVTIPKHESGTGHG